MTFADDEGGDGKVGYRHPPKSTQFKPGQSGNPSGRSKGAQSARSSFETLLTKTVQATVDGQPKRMSMKEALEMKVVEGATKLPPAQLLKLLSEFDSWIARDRELNAEMSQESPGPFVQYCVDCKDLVQALIILGLVAEEEGCVKIVPEVLFKFADRRVVEMDLRPALKELRRHYWPGTPPNRADTRTIKKGVGSNSGRR